LFTDELCEGAKKQLQQMEEMKEIQEKEMGSS
jgi:hypothetical protein